VDPSPTLYSALNLASEGPITGQSFALRLDRDIPHCRKVLAGYCHDGYLRITHRSKSGGGGHPTTYVATDKGIAKLAQLKNQREVQANRPKAQEEEPKPAKIDFGPLIACWGCLGSERWGME